MQDQAMGNSRGYTLVELVTVMVIFIIVIIMASNAFDRLLKTTSQQTKSAESQIEGIVGLEMLRYDIEHAGYGLPWSYPTGVTFSFNEAGSTPPAGTAVDSTVFGTFNETAPPRAFIATKTGSSATNPGTSYLVIKSVIAPVSQSVRRWSYAVYSSNSGISPPPNLSYVKKWQGGAGFAPNDFQSGDRVITLNTTFTGTAGTVGRTLVTSGTTFFYTIGTSTTTIPSTAAAFMPSDSTQTYTVYALGGQNDPLMPYNRADFYVKRPTTNMPSACNSGTGILYKGVVDNNAGTRTTPPLQENPLLDCVGDMQVVFQLDTDGDGIGGAYVSTDGTLAGTTVDGEGATTASVWQTLGSAASLRAQLRQVFVYVLTHEGGKDTNFVYPVADPNAAVVVADRTYRREGRVWSASDMQNKFGADWRNYRWKVYTLVIRPKNLN